jgi:hypothetical protein
VLFDTLEQKPQSKARRHFFTAIGVIVTIVVFFAAFPTYLWYPIAYYRESNTVRHFMNEIIAGNLQQAYQDWHPAPSYSFKDFLDDWGPNGYYGPVKSYRIGRPEHIKNGSAADIPVAVSPYDPFPSDGDMAKQNGTKVVHIWVDKTDHSLSFPGI